MDIGRNTSGCAKEPSPWGRRQPFEQWLSDRLCRATFGDPSAAFDGNDDGAATSG
jgi:hypothetical protein